MDVQAGLVINPFLLLPCEGEPEVSADIRGHKISVASLYKNEDATITVNLLVDGKMGCHEEVAALAVDEVLPLKACRDAVPPPCTGVAAQRRRPAGLRLSQGPKVAARRLAGHEPPHLLRGGPWTQ